MVSATMFCAIVMSIDGVIIMIVHVLSILGLLLLAAVVNDRRRSGVYGEML
jgi:hypothetical protein